MRPDTNWMTRIAARTRQDVEARKKQKPFALLKTFAKAAPKAPPFERSLRVAGRMKIIAEIKRKSPEKGLFAADLDATQTAAEYQAAGAVAVSVHTDGPFFGGSSEDLGRARAGCSLPLLRKEFVVDPYQIAEARVSGASAILLVASALQKKQLAEFLRLCAELGIDALVQVHDDATLESALECGAPIVSIDNTNPKTFEVDLGLTERLAPQARRAGSLVVAEGGVETPEDVRRIAAAGVDVCLVSDALVLSVNRSATMKALLEAGAA